MEWYWWVLIAIGVIVLGYIKLKAMKKMFGKKGGNSTETDEE